MPVAVFVWSLLAVVPSVAAPLLGFTPTPTFTITPTPTDTPLPTLTPRVSLVDPVITKRGDPAEAHPGEEVTFVIQVGNRGRAAAVDVVITDDVPAYLEIEQVTTTQGEVEVTGQRVTVRVGTVGPGFTVEIVIRTRVRDDAPAPIDLVNIATLHSPNGGDRTSGTVHTRIPGPYLPLTGDRRPAWGVFVLLVGGLAMVGIGAWGWRYAHIRVRL